MKSTGIVRNIDDLGRIVVPIEMRKKMNISNSDPVEIYVEDDKIILTKYQESCVFCGAHDNLSTFKEKKICDDCKNEING